MLLTLNNSFLITSLVWHQRTTWHIASHPVVIVPCTKLDAECDRQATVIGQLLIILGDDWHAVAKLFLVQRLGKTFRKNYTYLNVVFVWQIFSSLLFTVQILSQTQNDRVSSNVRSQSEALKGCKHLFQSVMVSVAVLKLGKTDLVFMQPGAKINVIVVVVSASLAL